MTMTTILAVFLTYPRASWQQFQNDPLHLATTRLCRKVHALTTSCIHQAHCPYQITWYAVCLITFRAFLFVENHKR